MVCSRLYRAQQATIHSLYCIRSRVAGNTALKRLPLPGSLVISSFAWWPLFIPFYNLYFILIMLPAEVTKAKQMAGVQAPARGIVVYFFLWLYALASDLNDIART